MRPMLKPALRLLTLAAAVAGSAWVATLAADQVEDRGRDAIVAGLVDGGFGWVTVDTDGLTATLTGMAPDESARFRALRAAGTRINPLHLRDAMTVLPPADLPDPEYRLELLKTRARLTMVGLVPGGLGALETLEAQLADVAPGLETSSLVSASAEAGSDPWSAATDAAIFGATALQEARAVLSEGHLRLTGLAPDAAAAHEVEARVRASLPAGFGLTVTLSVPRPTLSPFFARFRRDANGVAAFDACAASSPDGALKIRAAALAAGLPRASEPCVIAHGAPDDSWDRVAADAITALHGMGAGTVALSDLTVTLGAGDDVAPDALAAAAVRIEDALPDGYSLVVQRSANRGGTETPGPAPMFSATKSPEGLIQIRGPMLSAQSADLIGSFARARFPADVLTLRLVTRRDLPEGWKLRVLAGLDAFSALETGRLSVSPDLVALSGTTGSEGLSTELATRLAGALGPSEAIRIDVAYREDLDPVASLPTPEQCLDRIIAIQGQRKITFAPGSVDLDTDALRVVRRIAEVLLDCTGVDVVIGGHTDSQGGAEMNESLSKSRAEAVLTALRGQRVPASVLSAFGYGENDPVADNETADGREANRRIEFKLRYPLQGPAVPAALALGTQVNGEGAGDGSD